MRELEGFFTRSHNEHITFTCKDGREARLVTWTCPPDRLHEFLGKSPLKVRVTLNDDNEVEEVEVIPLV